MGKSNILLEIVGSLDGDLEIAVSVDTTSGAISSRLEPDYTATVHEPTHGDCQLFDTYEWSLWHDGLIAIGTGHSLGFFERIGSGLGTMIGSAEVPHSKPVHAWELDAGELGERLGAAMKLRTLMPMADFSVAQERLDIRNADGKLVLRMDHTTWCAGSDEKPIAGFAKLSPLRGYETDAEEIRDRMGPFREGASLDGPLDALLRSQSIQPTHYTLRPNFGFTSDDSARDAVQSMINAMLPIARENETGVIADADTEFLHDYRICIRKVRSVLSLIKGVYPERDVEFLKTELGAFARETNRLRDLDVYLLSKSAYEKRLPKSLSAGLTELFDDFAADRAREQKRIATHLASAAYRTRRKKLEAYFNAPSKIGAAPNADNSIGSLAAERIYKRYRKIVKAGRAVDADTPDAAIHELRIECKKLRYLLEFFSEIFPDPEVRKVEKQLRRLQSRLGNFNDLSVQQDALLEYLRKTRHPKGHSLTLAVGGLVGVLFTEQLRERDGIAEALHEFCAPALAAAVKARFKPQNPAPSGTES